MQRAGKRLPVYSQHVAATQQPQSFVLHFIMDLTDSDPEPRFSVVKGTIDGISNLMWASGLARGPRDLGPALDELEDSDYEAKYYVAQCRVSSFALHSGLLELILDCPASELGLQIKDRLRRIVDRAEGAYRMNPSIGSLAPILFDIVTEGVGDHPDENVEHDRTNRFARARDTLLHLDEFLIDGA
jgi:hypothetical protein